MAREADMHLAAAWAVAWSNEFYAACQFFSIINTAAQMYSIAFVLHSSRQHEWPRRNQLTIFVAKSCAGIGVLYTWKTWGVIEVDVTPFYEQVSDSADCCSVAGSSTSSSRRISA